MGLAKCARALLDTVGDRYGGQLNYVKIREACICASRHHGHCPLSASWPGQVSLPAAGCAHETRRRSALLVQAAGVLQVYKYEKTQIEVCLGSATAAATAARGCACALSCGGDVPSVRGSGSCQALPAQPFRQGADSEAGSGWRTASDSDDGGGASDVDAAGDAEPGPAAQHPFRFFTPVAGPPAGSAAQQGAAPADGAIPAAAAGGQEAAGEGVPPERPGGALIEAGAAGGSGAAALEAERCRQLPAENGAKVAAARQLLAGLLRAAAHESGAQAGASAAGAAPAAGAGIAAAGEGASGSKAATALHGADDSAPARNPEAAAAPGPRGAAPAPGVAPQGLGSGLGPSGAAPAHAIEPSAAHAAAKATTSDAAVAEAAAFVAACPHFDVIGARMHRLYERACSTPFGQLQKARQGCYFGTVMETLAWS